jgi:hypothetical protein
MGLGEFDSVKKVSNLIDKRPSGGGLRLRCFVEAFKNGRDSRLASHRETLAVSTLKAFGISTASRECWQTVEIETVLRP